MTIQRILRLIQHFAAGLLLGGFALNADAQYVWRDASGAKVYSDRPPPSDVAPARILKTPGQAASPTPAAASSPSTNPPAANPTLADREAEFNKRRAEQADKDKKAAADRQAAADKRAMCNRAAEAARTLESGERITRTDANGEKSFIDDQQRGREIAEMRRMLAECR